MIWTEEITAQFRDLYAQGLSHGQIGAAMGVSRNASIGKAHRLGLHTPKPPKPEPPWIAAGVHERTWQRWKAKAAAPDSGAKHYRRTPGGAHIEAAKFGNELIDLPPETVAYPVTLMDLGDHHCRWPHEVPDKPMMFCGADKLIGHAYCARHCRMAYVGPRPRSPFRLQTLESLQSG